MVRAIAVTEMFAISNQRCDSGFPPNFSLFSKGKDVDEYHRWR